MSQWNTPIRHQLLRVIAAAMLATSAVACSGGDPSIETTQEARTALSGEEEIPGIALAGSWSTLGAPTNGCGPGVVYASHQMANGDIIVGGGFTKCGSVTTNGIARWQAQTNTWSPIGGGVNGAVQAITLVGNDIYIGGRFTTAGGTPVNNVAMWNGTTWNNLGGGVPEGNVQALVQSNGVVYAAGQFTKIGGITQNGGIDANHVAKWNGSAWSALGPGGGGTNAFIMSLHAVGSNIYAGGFFNKVKDNNGSWIWAHSIAVWNGSTWNALGSGFHNGYNVYAIASNGAGGVYACGKFPTAGGSAAANVAMWNGITWSAMGAGLNGECRALRTFGGHLYAGGDFTKAGGSTANFIAMWDGTSWSPLMAGASNGVYGGVLTISGTNDLVVGGNFSFAGSIPARHVAIWHPSPIGPGPFDQPIPGPDPVPDPVWD